MGFKNYMAKSSSFPGSEPHALTDCEVDRSYWAITSSFWRLELWFLTAASAFWAR
jgi:hypothetical protein